MTRYCLGCLDVYSGHTETALFVQSSWRKALTSNLNFTTSIVHHVTVVSAVHNSTIDYVNFDL